MKVRTILGSIALFCGAFYAVMTDNMVKQTSKPTALIILDSVSPQSVKSPLYNKVNNTQPGINDNADLLLALANAKGMRLISALENFWKQCHQSNNCDEALIREQAKLSSNRFEILSLYPNNTFLREQLLGSRVLSQDIDLIDKIEHVKMIEQQIWGDEATVLFIDNYAQYDFNQEAQTLVEDVVNAETFITAYGAFIGRWGTQLTLLSLDSEEAKYEHAISLIPDHFSLSDKQQVMSQLQQTYLSKLQITSIKLRQREVTQQNHAITRYQAGLAQLNQTFIHLRKEEMSHLSEQAWEQYKANAKFTYRQDFFKI